MNENIMISRFLKFGQKMGILAKKIGQRKKSKFGQKSKF